MSKRRIAMMLAGLAVAAVVVLVAWPRKQQVDGRVVLRGAPPPEIKVLLDPATARLRPNGLTTRHYLVSSNGGLANTFIWIKSGLSNYATKPASDRPVMEFRLTQLEPYVLGVLTNQPVRFRNTDPLLHNCHCTPKAIGNREVNFSMPTAMPTSEPWYKALYRRFITRRPAPITGIDHSFSTPEPFVRVKCDVHPWEFGYVCVTDHPFFAITDKDGRFRMPGELPPGNYVMEARHLRCGVLTQEIVLRRGDHKQVEFVFDVPKR